MSQKSLPACASYRCFGKCSEFLLQFFLIISVTACTTFPRKSYVPDPQAAVAADGISDIRIWADASPAEITAAARFFEPTEAVTSRRLAILAISGGGSAGAFSAGLLSGWTDRGNRPQFDLVTGVSAGALVAPFAFLGSSYDQALLSAFSPSSTKSLTHGFQPIRLLLSNSIADGRSLKQLIDRAVTPALLQAIAVEHKKGRRLVVMTTNLDAQRPVIWNMGAIAESASSNSLELFREVLLASASIPGYYPPVRISAGTAAQPYQELHSDGGIFAQFFIAPDALMFTNDGFGISPKQSADLYIIVNNTLEPQFTITPDGIIGVAARAYETILKSHARATINSAFLFARSRELSFRLAYIEKNVPYDFRTPFSPEYIQAVSELGYETGLSGAWRRKPPTGDAEPRASSPVDHLGISTGPVVVLQQ